MKLFEMIKNFHNDESGAVTVDWVVLTAAVVGLGFAVLGTVKSGLQELGSAISTEVGGVTVAAGDGTP
jgi:Flp pilus assembly pilin Flp